MSVGKHGVFGGSYLPGIIAHHQQRYRPSGKN